MKKRILLISLTFLLILMVGCVNKDSKAIDNNQGSNKVGETEVVDKDVKNKTATVKRGLGELTSAKREDLGEYTPIGKMESENFSAENELIKITITDYILYKLKPNDEYKDFYKNIGIVNLDEVPILDIIFEFENLSNEMLELDSLQGWLTINTGEEQLVNLVFFEESNKNQLEFSGREVKKGSTTAILTSNNEDIESFKLIYDDSIILELDLK